VVVQTVYRPWNDHCGGADCIKPWNDRYNVPPFQSSEKKKETLSDFSCVGMS